MKNEKEILIIDDDNKNIFALSAVLKARKYNCIAALSAREGLEMLAENKNISVVLMDMMMPQMDGYEAIAQIKNDEKLSGIPVIAITAQAMMGDREKCMAAGADGYLSKPVNVDELLILLNDLMK
ncbi:response regulator [Chryseobacterium lacus]|uniref:Response regulator n=1 Tax=Chryseobacterium lacus TaxID=2058346 RepID=A0A368MZJ7_9FLAO|nr:response regulator [Chryseobacterium lacus]ODS90117.1 MAG: histidine kinase [Chryseobacterium sp. SCN 40-13]RCU42755.1 response regulator [Chryseobacterium lacus]RST27319.1 response regulator [Chryseobacterium lacus]RST28130.1 response regulator [Chryseobacterium lacus]